MSMGIVGVNSTVGRAVKCIDPGKTTRSESGWLGYSLCDLASRLYFAILCMYFALSLFPLLQHTTHRVGSNPILSGRFSHTAILRTHEFNFTVIWCAQLSIRGDAFLVYERVLMRQFASPQLSRALCIEPRHLVHWRRFCYLTHYNEERRLGDQRGSDTLVVPLITSNDGLSLA